MALMTVHLHHWAIRLVFHSALGITRMHVAHHVLHHLGFHLRLHGMGGFSLANQFGERNVSIDNIKVDPVFETGI